MTSVQARHTTNTAVWRAYAAIANRPWHGKPGSGYSPRCLLLIRWLAMRPGCTTTRLHEVHEIDRHDVQRYLERLRALGVVHRDASKGWHLSATGRELLELIDTEGVI